ncbi:MAG TPA: potassium channel family protein [Herpetosiphonaceae bacterium]
MRATRREQAAALIARSRKKVSEEERVEVLDQLIDVYGTLGPDDTDQARSVRRSFLLTLEDTPQIIQQERFSRFLAERIEPEDFAEFRWQSADAVIEYCDLLYSFRFQSDAMAEHVQSLERNLLRYALQQYEQQQAYEKMFQLLKLAPTLPALTDVELQRLRNRAYLYEMRRVRRWRRTLIAYLLLQVILIVVVFPLLFVWAESGVIQQQIESAASATLPDEAQRSFSYWDGLYWALITAASIGYGDVTPLTTLGRVLASALGVMGVVTIGVIAGLILNWLSPRRID